MTGTAAPDRRATVDLSKSPVPDAVPMVMPHQTPTGVSAAHPCGVPRRPGDVRYGGGTLRDWADRKSARNSNPCGTTLPRVRESGQGAVRGSPQIRALHDQWVGGTCPADLSRRRVPRLPETVAVFDGTQGHRIQIYQTRRMPAPLASGLRRAVLREMAACPHVVDQVRIATPGLVGALLRRVLLCSRQMPARRRRLRIRPRPWLRLRLGMGATGSAGHGQWTDAYADERVARPRRGLARVWAVTGRTRSSRRRGAPGVSRMRSVLQRDSM